jgi:sugar (pentulose or hexulose) kinase
MHETFLAFDFGTTALKTALVSGEGRPLAAYTREYTPKAPRPDWVEMMPEVYWQVQMKADLLGIVVERPACPDATCLGAAMLAATGVGRFPNLTEASEAWYLSSRLFEPDPSRYAIYREVYTRYLSLMRRLYSGTDPVVPILSGTSG